MSNTPFNFENGNVVQTSNTARRSRRSKYDPLWEQVSALSPGQTFTFDAPEDSDVDGMRRKVTAAMNKFATRDNAANRYSVFVTEDQKIAISCSEPETGNLDFGDEDE